MDARELDMIWLSALVFMPAAFGLLLLIIPSRFREVLRWVALFGTAITLAISLCVWVDYYRVLEFHSDRTERSMYHPQSRLDSRVLRQQANAAAP